MTGPRVVIVGAGVVGAALADELTARGWDDVTVVDQGDLPAPGGSTSHAPGLVFQASGSRTMTALARYTVEKLGGLEVDGEPCFLQVGGLEVATTPERLAEIHRRHGWLTGCGVEAHLLDAAGTAARHPLLDPEVVLGGLWVPTDGLAKAVRAVDAQTRRAASRGARLLPRHEVLDITVTDGRVTGVVTDQGELPADVVVCCAGIWGPVIAAKVGMTLPLTPLAHQLAWTSSVPALAGRDEEAVLPILRHQDQDLYYRERFDTLGIGYYGHRPMPIRAQDIARLDASEVMPSVLEFTQEDFEEAWRQTQLLLPSTRDAKIEEGINGLFSFTTDNMPLIGQSPDVSGFWVAEAVWVTHSAGVGRAVAELLVDGHCSSFDLHECDVNRFEPHQLSPQYVLTRDCQNFVEVYDILHPLQPAEDLRPLRTSPFHQRQRELGAVFLEASGWERPQWYAANAGLVDGRDIPTPERLGRAVLVADRRRRGAGDPRGRGDVRHDGAEAARGDRPGGRGVPATAWSPATWTSPSARSPTASCSTSTAGSAATSPSPGWRSTGSRSAPTATSTSTGSRRHLPPDGTVQVRDLTPGTCCIGLWGPRARDLLQPLTDTDVRAGPEVLPCGRGLHRHRPGHRAAPVLRRRARLGALHHGRPRPAAVGPAVGGRPGARRHRRRPRRLQQPAAGEGLPLVRRAT